MTLSETSTEIHRKLVFLAMFEREKFSGKFEFVYTTVFDQNIKKEYILKKNVFVHKVSQILLNYAFLSFEAFWGKFIDNFSY